MAKHIRIGSDFHLEGFCGLDEEKLALDFLPKDDRDKDSILVLAGDISSIPDQLIAFLSVCEKRFKHTVYVPGNHEVYRHNINAWDEEMRRRFDTELANTFATTTREVRSVDICGVRFIYGTMWGDGGPTLEDQARTGFYLNDFRLIRVDEGFVRFTVQDMVAQFKMAKQGIEQALASPFDGKKVVVTHHLPSRRLVSKRFWPSDGSDGANGGFVGNCDDILAKTEIAPDLWIFGHTHDTVDTELWRTRAVCNPAGYRGEWVSPYNSFMTVDGNGIRTTVPKFIDL